MLKNKNTPSNKLHKRLNQNRLRLWFLMKGKRWLVTSILVVIIFTTLVIIGYAFPTTEKAIRDSDSIDTLFQGLLTAIITGVTIVVSLNQLVLSQELGSFKDQRERMEGAMKIRKDAEDILQIPISPTKPTQFIQILVQASSDRAKSLQNAADNISEDKFKEEIDNFTNSLIKNAKQVSKGLDNATFGEFEVISSALGFNYSWKIFAARNIKMRNKDLLTKKTEKELNNLIEILNLFGPTREHFKTLYFQSDLIDLSRRILFAAIPALLISSCMIIFFNFNTFSLIIFNIETLIIMVALAITISLLPFLILISYVLRIATVTKHTLAIGPFILRQTNQDTEVDETDL